MHNSFSETVSNLLRQSGWHEGRCVPVEEVCAFLEKHSYHVNAQAEAFFREYHCLTLASENCRIVFDPEKAHPLIDSGDTPHLESLTQESLCPIGHTAYGTLFMSQSGKVVYLDDGWVLIVVFDDYVAMLEGLSGADPTLVAPIHLTSSQLPPSCRAHEDEE